MELSVRLTTHMFVGVFVAAWSFRMLVIGSSAVGQLFELAKWLEGGGALRGYDISKYFPPLVHTITF